MKFKRFLRGRLIILRKVFDENIPKRIYKGRDCFDWESSIGLKIKFIYEEVRGFIEIIDYNKKSCRLVIKYKEELMEINAHHLLECKIANLLGIKTSKYKYKVGQIINGIEIIEQVRYRKSKYKEKGYKYRCINDGYVGECTESSIKGGSGCPVCSNNLVIKGINDIATTNPELLPYIVNKEDAYIYSIGTKTKIKTQCLHCGYQKELQPNLLKNHIFKCLRCGDGVSYPEKFIFCLLEQLNVDFVTQKIFGWSKKKLYDFYIPELNIIIETHGLQHYEFRGGKWSLLENEKANDQFKQRLAGDNEIENYIVLDCRESDMEWIKQQVCNSKISNLYDLSKIDWMECHKMGLSSKVKEACNLWNNYSSNTKIISEEMKLSRNTVINYLKQGVKLGWCDYDPKKNIVDAGKNTSKRTKAVIMYDENNGMLGVFNSITELSKISLEKFGVELNQPYISYVCNGKKDHYKGYKFKYVTEVV